jgi:hypothetical protein
MPAARRSPAPVRSLPLERRFPAATRRHAERDWVFFLLEELNGIGDILRFRREEGQARPDEALARARAIVTALGWQPEAAVAHTWAFVQARLQFPEDAWGPDLILARLDPSNRWRSWRDNLGDDARVLLTAIPDPTQPPG